MSSAEHLRQEGQIFDQKMPTQLDAQLTMMRQTKVGHQLEASEMIADTLVSRIADNRGNAHDVLYEFRTKAPTKLEVVLGDPTENARMKAAGVNRTSTMSPHLHVVSPLDANVVTEKERKERMVIQSHAFERMRVYMTTIKRMMQSLVGKEAGFEGYKTFRDEFMEGMSAKMKAHDELVKAWNTTVRSQDKGRTYASIDAEMTRKIADNEELSRIWEAEKRRQNGKPSLGHMTHDDFSYELENEIAALAEALESKRSAKQAADTDTSMQV